MAVTVIESIPTEYAGVRFRSKLEARWALMFDLLELTWDYEPAIDFTAYIPDFLVRVPLRRATYARKAATALVLAEVKPIVTALDYEDPVRKIALSGWEHAAVVLCPTPWQTAEGLWAIGIATDRVERRDALPGGYTAWHPVGFTVDNELELGGGRDIRDFWRRSGNKLQWLPKVTP